MKTESFPSLPGRAGRLATRKSTAAVSTAVMLLAGLLNGQQALANGTNSTHAAATPPTPSYLSTSQQVSDPSDATCSQQLTNLGIVAQAAGTAAQLAGVTSEAAELATEDGFANPAPATGAAADAVGLGTSLAALYVQVTQAGLGGALVPDRRKRAHLRVRRPDDRAVVFLPRRAGRPEEGPAVVGLGVHVSQEIG